ncbi:MAG: ABC transporter substrate-binding protein [Desulfobacteraceae bacterium]|jgi:glycine betaine/proline transport system substrate-binding protein
MKQLKRGMFSALVTLAAVGLLFGTAPAADKTTIIFADFGWDSAQVHNRIAAFIIEKGLGYPVKYVQGETIMLNTALIQAKGGEAPNVNMETWTENWQELYDEGLAKGKDPNTDEGFVNLGSNFPNSVQGWYVPRYVVEGDTERGIKPTAPDLKSVFDLPKYWKLFQDPEDPGKGRFHSCIPGWSCALVNEKKFEAYGIKENYNIMQPGSGPALAASMETAYKRGKPWLGYYWAPTWVLGKLDMLQLEEPAFDQKIWDTTKACAYPAVKCDIVVHKRLPEKAPDVIAFLKNYETTLDINNKFLAYMQDNKASTEEAAAWFLKTYEDLWTGWVPADVAAKVKAAMK